MSGFSYPQPIFISDTYNPSFYLSLDQTGYLTYAYAQTLYLDRNDYRLSYLTGISDGTASPNLALVPASDGSITGLGALSCSSLTVGGQSVVAPPSYVVGITAGTAANNKALVLDGSGAIATITSLTATSITGTLQTGAQGNITSLGTLSGLTIGGDLTFTGASRTISGLSSISATTLTGALSTAAQTAITSVGTLTNLTLSTGGTGLQLPNLKFWNSTTSLYDNFNQAYYLSVVEGGCVAQKALIVDINKDIGSIRTLNAVNLNGSTLVSGTVGDFGSIKISGTEIITNGRHIQNIGNIACSGTMNAFAGYQVNSVAFVDASRNITAGNISGTESVITSSAGTALITSSTANSYDLQLKNVSSVSGSTTGIAFTIHASADLATITPTAAIIARSTGTGTSSNYPPSDISFYTRAFQIQVGGSLQERMRIHGDGKISFGDIGDQKWNMLQTNATCSLRFGANLSVNDCFTWTYNYTSSGSANNYLALNSYGTSNCMTWTNGNLVGIGTSTPACGLDVSTSASVSMTGPLATGTSSAYTVNRAGTFTDSVSIYCRQALMVGVRGLYVGSDRRVKENISTIPPEDGVKFVRDINPKIYDLKGFDKRQIGYISQDMMQDYSALLSLLPDPNMTIEEEGDVDGAFISLSYERVPAFLHAALKSVLDRLDELNNRLSTIETSLHENGA